jgi:hypothetical protein
VIGTIDISDEDAIARRKEDLSNCSVVVRREKRVWIETRYVPFVQRRLMHEIGGWDLALPGKANEWTTLCAVRLQA